MKKYIPSEIEKKWQKKWYEESVYQYKADPKKKKYYTLVELPYTSGDLHVGHWFNWATPDVYSRFKKMKGYDIFFPHGYDTIGLPAENAAIKNKIHPRDWTMKNVETMQAQFKTLGSMIDLDDVTLTCTPEYFKWNQWIFIEMFKKGIAYRGTTLSNWCPVDKTVLADEHVENGRCWRCGTLVEKKEVAQWFLKITAYADQLIWPEKPSVDWPTSVRVGQNAWIGKSTGVELTFKFDGSSESVTVFTTALDTVYGVTFMVLSPEHPLVSKIAHKDHKHAVEKYVHEAARKSELERMQEGKDKTGIFTGAYVLNPFNNEKVPVWVADYVLMGYGTGAVMGVPGHDARDHEFALKLKLPVKIVVKPSTAAKDAKVGKDGFWDYQDIKKHGKNSEVFDSGEFSGLNYAVAKAKMEHFIEVKRFGKRRVQYHIRDWSVSRQRYWGTPVPMIHCSKCGIVPVPEKDLPIDLPYDVDFTPKGKAPLASNEKWMKVKCPQCGGPAERDPETLDTFFDSAWYYYRYLNNQYERSPFDSPKAKKMMPVDIYFGGAEHTLGHTLYARFFTKFFKDLGLIDFDEFALKRVQHGIVLGPDGNKMSKSKGNVINPDDVVKEYGADTVRTYLTFMMPYEGTAPWSTEAIAGVFRFLQRIWQLREKVKREELRENNNNESDSLIADREFQLNSTIQKVERDLEQIKGNTAIAFIMTWLNYLSKKEEISREEYRTLLLLLAPFAPHIAEELWTAIGEQFSIHNQPWPTVKEAAAIATTVKIPVQVNGKVRAILQIPSNMIDQASVEEIALKEGSVQRHLEGKKHKTIYVPGKILNLVVSG